MATSFGDILRQQQMLQQQQQQIGQQQSQNINTAGGLMGKVLRGKMGAGAAATAPVAPGGAGFQLGQPLVTGQMGASSMAGGAGAGFGPVLAAGVAAQNADKIGNAFGGLGDKMGLGKTGIPDQARAAGNFVKGDFGAAWGNLKDSVKNIFSIF